MPLKYNTAFLPIFGFKLHMILLWIDGVLSLYSLDDGLD